MVALVKERVSDVLARFLKNAHRSHDQRAVLLNALNAAIEDNDRDFKIGPSYLMRPEADTEAGLGRVWRYDLMPLLEEHYYGRMTRAEIHERFGLPRLREVLLTSDRTVEVTAPEASVHEPSGLHAEGEAAGGTT